MSIYGTENDESVYLDFRDAEGIHIFKKAHGSESTSPARLQARLV